MGTPHPMSIPHTYSTGDHGLLIPIAGVPLPVDANYHVFIHEDPRGPSEDYEGYSLVALTGLGRIAWVEGIRKDRSQMRSQFKDPIDAFMAGV